MSVTVPEPIGRRGEKDSRRHREKQKEAIRKNLPEIISEESIITGKGNKKIKVPIKSLDIPRFRPGNRKRENGDGDGGDSGGIGIGQGSGKPGDEIYRRPGKGQGQKPGEPGTQPGTDYIESEIDLEELIEMMFEDLGLPNLQKKDIAELEVVLGFKIQGITKSGPRVLLEGKRSSTNPFGRFYAFLQMLQDATSRDELTCFSALKETNGNYGDALALLEDLKFQAKDAEVEPFPIYHEEDLRFHNIRENIRHESNAVVIAMMDVSGSMTTLKKYLARSMLFWLVKFLETIYKRVEVRFIIHHYLARLTDEYEFFHTTESGGTRCASAYEIANDLIETRYPTKNWNVYAFHFSDGEDLRPLESMAEAKKFFEKGINMFGYGEIKVDEYYTAYSNLLPAFTNNFPVRETSVNVEGENMKIFLGEGDFPFLGVVIEGRSYIWPALREFLKRERWS